MDNVLDARQVLRRLALPLVVCCVLLGVAYARTSPGTAHPSPWGYRNWSFSTLTYSDILALHEDRGGGAHPLPYLKDKIEYPVLLGLSMWWPSVVQPNRAGYFALTFLLLAICAVLSLYLIGTFPNAKPWFFAASPALVVYSALNWDLLGILPLILGIWLWARGREHWAAFALSIAVWTKFFPVLVLGVLLVVATRKSWKHALRLAGIFVAVTLALNLPFAIAAPANWRWFFEYNRIREIEPSLYLLLGNVSAKGFAPTANTISAAVTLAAAAAIALYELRTRRLEALPAACALVCVFFTVNKVYSPQYWLWVVALTALVGLPDWLLSVVGCTALCDFIVSFMLLHLQAQRDPQWTWFHRSLFWPMVAVRYSVLAACAVSAFSRSRRVAI
jgi:uncharacterized membrane protein